MQSTSRAPHGTIHEDRPGRLAHAAVASTTAREGSRLMRRVSLLVALLLLGACAGHQPADPPLRVKLMARCVAACDPAEVVQASIAVDSTDDLWQCLCKSPESAVTSGT